MGDFLSGFLLGLMGIFLLWVCIAPTIEQKKIAWALLSTCLLIVLLTGKTK